MSGHLVRPLARPGLAERLAQQCLGATWADDHLAEKALDHAGLGPLLELERACAPVFASQRGLPIDERALHTAHRRARQARAVTEVAFRESRIRFQIGQMNVMSDEQCRRALSDFGLPVADVRGATLRGLGHPFPTALAVHRDAVREEAFIRRMIAFTRNGFLFGLADQLGSTTGRPNYSSFELASIPRRLRMLIRAAPGKKLLNCDYRARDMTCLAALSGDPTLIEHVTGPADLYLATAATMWRTDLQAVTREEREVAKVALLAINYGRTPFGLMESLDCTYDEAHDVIEELKAIYPRAEEFLQCQAEQAVRTRTIATQLGRRRFFDPHDRKDAVRRRARNFVVQGCASDSFKERLAALWELLNRRNFGRLLLTLHDSVLVECPREAASEAIDEITQLLSRSPMLTIPLRLAVGQGETWAAAEEDGKKQPQSCAAV